MIRNLLASLMVLTFVGTLLWAFLPQDEKSIEVIRREAAEEIAHQAVTDFLSQLPDSGDRDRVAILPLGRDFDDGYTRRQLENALTRDGRGAGYQPFAREDGTLDDILKEVRFNQEATGLLNPATIQKIGQLKGIFSIFRGWVRDSGDFLEVDTEAYDPDGGKIWGGSFRVPMQDTAAGQIPTGLKLAGGAAVFVVLFLMWAFLGRLATASRPR